MFGLFKKKTEREKLMDLYKKKKEEAFNISKIDRKKSDQLEKEIQLMELEKLEMASLVQD